MGVQFPDAAFLVHKLAQDRQTPLIGKRSEQASRLAGAGLKVGKIKGRGVIHGAIIYDIANLVNTNI